MLQNHRKGRKLPILHIYFIICTVQWKISFQEIAKTFENKVEDPAKYHRELLKRMYMDIPGIRPKSLSLESYHALDELRGFRHIFRHAYDYELDPERVDSLKQKIVVNGII